MSSFDCQNREQVNIVIIGDDHRRDGRENWFLTEEKLFQYCSFANFYWFYILLDRHHNQVLLLYYSGILRFTIVHVLDHLVLRLLPQNGITSRRRLLILLT